MRLFILLSLLLPAILSAHDLSPVNKTELATVLGLLDELATTPAISNQPHIVRVYAVPIGVFECGGTVASCPDVRLLVTVSNGDLGETPVLYELPAQKGWEFMGWGNPTSSGRIRMSSFGVRTALPDSNVDLASRNAWHARAYRVLVSPESASYVSE